jgi:hypothetical protein
VRRAGIRRPRPRSRRGLVLPGLLLAALAAPVGPGPGDPAAATAAVAVAAATPAATRVETPVASSSPITDVVESLVRVYVPLPASAGAHPAACDWLSYLRYRSASGPAASASADRVLVAQPGVYENAGAFDSVARNTVSAAARQGSHIEFWALSRRSNCLEDATGLQAAAAAHDPSVAIGYYYGGASVSGHAFAGFLSSGQTAWLAQVGIAQTVQDEYDLLAEELPGQALRKQKVLCGGHSLGGTITAFFADWDFAGQPGYQQCAGYFALDTSIATSLSSLNGAPSASDLGLSGLAYPIVQAGLNSGLISSYASLPAVLNPETMNLLGIAGVAADVAPNGQSGLAAAIPSSDTNVTLTERLLLSQNLGVFLTGSPAPADFRLTNDAALGSLLDDNSQPLAFLETACGFFDGGPLADKDFPLPSNVASVPGLGSLAGTLLGGSLKAIPSQPHGPLYTWDDYNRIPASGTGYVSSGAGRPYTAAADEVTSIRELARSLGEQPLEFTEQYFPTKLLTDISLSSAPDIASHLLYPGGTSANPVINLLAGSGLVVASGNPPPGPTVVAPGYHHLDVLTAAPQQNDGQAEPISAALAGFAIAP